MAQENEWDDSVEEQLQAKANKLSLFDDDEDDAALQQALQQATDKVAADGNNADAHFELAHAYQNLDDDEHAVASYNKAIELNNSKVLYYQDKASLLTSLNHYDEAAATLQAAINVEPNNAQLYYELARVFQSNEEHKKANEMLEQAVSKNAQHAPALFQLARYALDLQKDKEKALDLLRRVIAVDHSHVQAHTLAGQILQEKKTAGDAKEAASYLAEAVRLDGTDVQLRARLIQCYDLAGMDGEREQARAALHQAYEAKALNPSYNIRPRYCCAQFEVADKFVMAFDHSKPESNVKFALHVYKKGEVHEDKVLNKITVQLDGSSYKLICCGEVKATYDAEPSFSEVKEQAIKLLA